jgi:hypothetical protein
MTPVAFVCPKCHAKYKAKQTPAADLKLTCQKCQMVFRPAENLVEASPPPHVGTTASQPAAPAPTVKIEMPPTVAPSKETPHFPELDFTSPSQVIPPPEVPFVIQDDSIAADVLNKVTKGRSLGKPSSSTVKNIEKSKATSAPNLIMGGIAVVALLGGLITFFSQESAPPIDVPGDMQKNVAASASPAATALADRQPDEKPRTPINLFAVPAGMRLFAHLNVKELLRSDSNDASVQAVKFILTSPFGKSLEEAIHRPLEQVDSLLVGVLLGPVGSKPDFAYRVTLAEGANALEPVSELKATPTTTGERGLYTLNGNAILIRDAKSYSIAPERYGAEMVSFQTEPAFTDSNLETILKMTDASKAITFCGKFEDLLTHAKQLVGASRAQVLEWLGRTAEKSADLFLVEADVQELFEVNAQLIPHPNTNAMNIQRQFQQQFKAAPSKLVDYLKQRSAMTLGEQKLAGRFPAMIQATVMSTEIDVKKNIATIETKLPAKAWPNLLLAGYSCWESDAMIYRPDQMQVAGSTTATTQKVEKTWQQRLVTEVEIDFKRSPLQDAVSYIADETKLTFDIDGDALKLSGYTKNMPQNFTLGKVPAIKGLQSIFAQYDAMCMIKGEAANQLIITTKPVATSAGKTPLNLEELAKTPPAP